MGLRQFRDRNFCKFWVELSMGTSVIALPTGVPTTALRTGQGIR